MPPMATSASTLALPLLRISPPMPARASPSTITIRRRLLPAACAYTLQEGQSRRFHRLPCDLDLEVIAQHPPTPAPAPTPGKTERPPLVFVHGSFHAAWCLAERWMPFFSSVRFFALDLCARQDRPYSALQGAGHVKRLTSKDDHLDRSDGTALLARHDQS